MNPENVTMNMKYTIFSICWCHYSVPMNGISIAVTVNLVNLSLD